MKPLVVMLHGRNAGPENILDLVPRLAVDCDYVAPAAPNRTWYPYSFMADIEKNEPHLSQALAMLRRTIEEAEATGVPRRKIVLLGFSQGACLATEFAIRNASRFGGVIAFSGGAIGPPGTKWGVRSAELGVRSAELGVRSRESGVFDGTPMFFGCSDVDAHVPVERVRESAAVCERMGAKVTTRIYPGMGHLVNDDEIAWARALLESLA